jgi:hypothetical protein
MGNWASKMYFLVDRKGMDEDVHDSGLA